MRRFVPLMIGLILLASSPGRAQGTWWYEHQFNDETVGLSLVREGTLTIAGEERRYVTETTVNLLSRGSFEGSARSVTKQVEAPDRTPVAFLHHLTVGKVSTRYQGTFDTENGLITLEKSRGTNTESLEQEFIHGTQFFPVHRLPGAARDDRPFLWYLVPFQIFSNGFVFDRGVLDAYDEPARDLQVSFTVSERLHFRAHQGPDGLVLRRDNIVPHLQGVRYLLPAPEAKTVPLHDSVLLAAPVLLDGDLDSDARRVEFRLLFTQRPDGLTPEQNAQQSISAESRSFLDVLTKITPFPPEVTLKVDGNAPATDLSPLADGSAEVIRRRTEELVGDVANPLESGRIIGAWVRHNIMELPWNGRPRDAGEVLLTAEGTPLERAMLTAAMLRAHGFQARMVCGLTYREPFRAFFPHTFLEVRLDQWRPFDPIQADPWQVPLTTLKLTEVAETQLQDGALTPFVETLEVISAVAVREE